MKASGMADSAIKQTLMNDLNSGGPLFGSFRNKLKNTVRNGVELSSNGSANGTFTKAGVQEFQWISVGDGKVCPDCEGRHGETGTMEFFETIGLPASGFSVCTTNCRCQLVPETYKGENLDKPLVKGKRQDAGWKPSMPLKKAESFSKSSKVRTTLFHGTTEIRKNSITNRGFILESKKNGRMWGDGVYLSYQSEQATEWARLTMLRDWSKVKSKQSVLNVKTNVKNPLIINSGDGFPKKWTEKFMKARSLGYEGKRGSYYTNLAKKEGYDSIIIKMPRRINESYDDWLVRTGGDQIVVFNVKNVVTVND
tara:strand:+ start:498 stop:1427 length:930 start_codon:yes stop_codon:yes gene_type:complete